MFVGEGALGAEPDLFIVEVDGESVDVCALSCASGVSHDPNTWIPAVAVIYLLGGARIAQHTPLQHCTTHGRRAISFTSPLARVCRAPCWISIYHIRGSPSHYHLVPSQIRYQLVLSQISLSLPLLRHYQHLNSRSQTLRRSYTQGE